MKKRMAVVLGLVLIMTAMIVGVVSADGIGEGAVVYDGFGCFISAGAWGGPVTLTSNDSHSVMSPSGNVTLTCHFEIPSSIVVDASKHEGWTCNTLFGSSTNTWSVTSPDDGEVMIKCKIKK